MAIKIQYYKTPVGELIIGDYQGELCLCDWRYRKMRSSIDKRICGLLGTEYKEQDSPLIAKVKKQLEEYFIGERKEFEIPLLLIGTPFQKSVWEELLRVPYGKTDTYYGLSQSMGNVKAIRAVATANGANAISIIVPCHRIIGSDGSLVGYAGGLVAKKKLLMLEGWQPQMGQLKLF